MKLRGYESSKVRDETMLIYNANLTVKEWGQERFGNFLHNLLQTMEHGQMAE